MSRRGGHRRRLDSEADYRLHPRNFSLFDPPGVPLSSVRAYASTRPTKGDVAYDSGVDVPSPTRRMYSMATFARYKQGVSSSKRELSAGNTWSPYWVPDLTALRGDVRTPGNVTEDGVYRDAIR